MRHLRRGEPYGNQWGGAIFQGKSDLPMTSPRCLNRWSNCPSLDFSLWNLWNMSSRANSYSSMSRALRRLIRANCWELSWAKAALDCVELFCSNDTENRRSNVSSKTYCAIWNKKTQIFNRSSQEEHNYNMHIIELVRVAGIHVHLKFFTGATCVVF